MSSADKTIILITGGKEALHDERAQTNNKLKRMAVLVSSSQRNY